MVHYVLNVTGQAKLSYIGHSQGTTMAFAAFVTNAELASKINFYVALVCNYLYNTLI